MTHANDNFTHKMDQKPYPTFPGLRDLTTRRGLLSKVIAWFDFHFGFSGEPNPPNETIDLA